MNRRSDKQIMKRVNNIDADERFHYPCADIHTNAPLALIQLEMEATVSALAWVLGIKAPKSGPRKAK